MSRMTSVDDATAILRRFQENHYPVNEKALSIIVEALSFPRFFHIQWNED